MTITFEFWILFNLLVAGMLFIDLKLVHKNAHAVSVKEAAAWSCIWISVALLFNLGIYHFMGREKAFHFFTGYIIEKSLSVDNLFVFLMIFEYFNVPLKYQPLVLHWGILGAIVMRFILIFTGVSLLETFHWIVYLFGFLLVVTGVRTAIEKEKKMEPEKNMVLRAFKKICPVRAGGILDDKFFVKLNGVWHATPLFLVLLIIESSDLIFAVDSIPAVLAITTDTFIVYTSNVFAILGLRALYFLLSSLMPYFTYLKFGISLVLCFVGAKMLISHYFHISTTASLLVVAALLGSSVLASLLWKPRRNVPADKP